MFLFSRDIFHVERLLANNSRIAKRNEQQPLSHAALHACKTGCGGIGALSKCSPGRRTYFGSMSEPCCMIEPTVSHIEFFRSKLFSNSSGSGLHGCGLSHSPGAILQINLPFNARNLFKRPASFRIVPRGS